MSILVNFQSSTSSKPLEVSQDEKVSRKSSIKKRLSSLKRRNFKAKTNNDEENMCKNVEYEKSDESKSEDDENTNSEWKAQLLNDLVDTAFG